MNTFDVYPRYPIDIERGKGVFLYDKQGNTFLDLYGGHAVISIGHSHPLYVSKMKQQLDKIAFYSNSIQNDLQEKYAKKLLEHSQCPNYSLFFCNSGAEANENALKLASFHNGKHKVLAFKKAFHGRTSATVAVTDNSKVQANLNTQHAVTFIEMNDEEALVNTIEKEGFTAIIFETIQGVGGLDQMTKTFAYTLQSVAKKKHICLIADEIQSGCYRTGEYFAFQHNSITPDLITTAKGIGNGFPMAAVFISSDFKSKAGLLGTTFGGNYLATQAGLSVLEVIENENVPSKIKEKEKYFKECAKHVSHIKKIKGRGLMLGVEFDFPVAKLRKDLLMKKNIFTGGSSNPNLIRILPPLNVEIKHLDMFFEGLKAILETEVYN